MSTATPLEKKLLLVALLAGALLVLLSTLHIQWLFWVLLGTYAFVLGFTVLWVVLDRLLAYFRGWE